MRIRGLLWVWMAAVSGCISASLPSGGRPVSEIHPAAEPHEIRIADRPSPLRARQKIPVLSPPEVFAVYVPTHIERDRDLMVGEHWVFFKLRDASWFPEQEEEQNPPAAGEATPNDLQRLRASTRDRWAPLVVPWKEEKP